MPNDAKLGLVVGVGLVITVAVVFFRKDLVATKGPSDEAAVAVSAVHTSPSPPPRGLYRTVKARTAHRTEDGVAGRQHTVQQGDSLFSLAQQYYGDGDKFPEIYRANREVVKNPEQLTPGTVLLIPDLPHQ